MNLKSQNQDKNLSEQQKWLNTSLSGKFERLLLLYQVEYQPCLVQPTVKITSMNISNHWILLLIDNIQRGAKPTLLVLFCKSPNTRLNLSGLTTFSVCSDLWHLAFTWKLTNPKPTYPHETLLPYPYLPRARHQSNRGGLLCEELTH